MSLHMQATELMVFINEAIDNLGPRGVLDEPSVVRLTAVLSELVVCAFRVG
jgi:hypothetical protein